MSGPPEPVYLSARGLPSAPLSRSISGNGQRASDPPAAIGSRESVRKPWLYNQSERRAGRPVSALVRAGRAGRRCWQLSRVVLSGHGSSFCGGIEQRHQRLPHGVLLRPHRNDHPDIVIVSVGDNVSATARDVRPGAHRGRSRPTRPADRRDRRQRAARDRLRRAARRCRAIRSRTRRCSARCARPRRAFVIGVALPTTSASAEQSSGASGSIASSRAPAGRTATSRRSTTRAAAPSRSNPACRRLGPVPDSFALLMARALRPEVRRNFGSISWLQKVDESGWFSRCLNLGAPAAVPRSSMPTT